MPLAQTNRLHPPNTLDTSLDINHFLRPGLLQLGSLPPLSLYIHLPWCLKKCPYCDFNSHALRRGSHLEAALQTRYLQALQADLEAVLPLIWGRPVHTVFIGGGTPSLFEPEAIDALLSMVRARLPLDADAEITLEANPGTFERERFLAFRQAGVTRLSVGVQSFNDEKLTALGRVHSASQAQQALTEVAQHFKTWNLDLMYALPGQTLEELQADLDTALSFHPPHLSIYHLTLEPNTYFASHPPELPDEDTAYAMMDRITDHTAQHGLMRYEVSAYARNGKQCRHNLNYWQFGDYVGIGAGAHSKLSFAPRIVRQTRWREPEKYMASALNGQAVSSSRDITRNELPLEYMMNALRLTGGFSLTDFQERTGLPLSSVQTALEKAEEQGLVQRKGTHVQPSNKGIDFLNDLTALFMA
jgi:oxygen-independent coproporphyrinogen-3 oxidase